jgi:hypothetical protein
MGSKKSVYRCHCIQNAMALIQIKTKNGPKLDIQQKLPELRLSIKQFCRWQLFHHEFQNLKNVRSIHAFFLKIWQKKCKTMKEVKVKVFLMPTVLFTFFCMSSEGPRRIPLK